MLAEALDHFNFARQMIRVVRPDAVQFVQKFLRDALRLGVLHTVHHAMSNRLYGCQADFLFEPIDQECRPGAVIGSLNSLSVPVIPSWVVEGQVSTGEADAVHFPVK